MKHYDQPAAKRLIRYTGLPRFRNYAVKGLANCDFEAAKCLGRWDVWEVMCSSNFQGIANMLFIHTLIY